MTNTSRSTMLLSIAALLMAVPAFAAGPAPAKPAKLTPCRKDQVEIISKVTGASYCAAMGGITVMGGAGQPYLLPEKPARKPKK